MIINSEKVSNTGSYLIMVDPLNFSESHLNLCLSLPRNSVLSEITTMSHTDGMKVFHRNLIRLAENSKIKKNYYLMQNPDFGGEIYRTISVGIDTFCWYGYILTRSSQKAPELQEVVTTNFTNLEAILFPENESISDGSFNIRLQPGTSHLAILRQTSLSEAVFKLSYKTLPAVPSNE